MCCSLIMPSQVHVLLFANVPVSLLAVHRVGRNTTAGGQEATQPLHLDTRTPALTSACSPSAMHTRGKNTQSNHYPTRSSAPPFLSREGVTGQKCISWPLGCSSAVCHPSVCPELRPDSRIASAIIRCASEPSILMPPDRDAPWCPNRTKHPEKIRCVRGNIRN